MLTQKFLWLYVENHIVCKDTTFSGMIGNKTLAFVFKVKIFDLLKYILALNKYNLQKTLYICK